MAVFVFWGLPGSGKTTFAVKVACDKSYKNHYINFPVSVPGVTLIKNEWIGKYDMRDGALIIDEASLFADNRAYKDFNKALLSLFMLHRHYNLDIFLFTQGYNAIDKKIRTVCDRVYYVVKHPLLGHWISVAYRVPYGIKWTQDHNGKDSYGDIEEGYKRPSFFERLTAKRVFRPRYYKYFDSWDAPALPPLPTVASVVRRPAPGAS